MDIQKLKYFISAAENLNFTKAAKDCFITQTAMSQLIANMEKELGFKLFLRNNRNMSLTAAGQTFYDQMKIMVASYENTVYHCQQISLGGGGKYQHFRDEQI